MDDVTRVPRTLTRRGALGAIAAATAAVTVAGARPADAAPAIDPIYAAIEQHRHTAKIWGSAVDAEACFPDRHMNNEQARQFEFLQQAREAARDTLADAGVDLVTTEPTTLAGIIAAVTYVRIQMRDDAFMPWEVEFEFEYAEGCAADYQQTMGWLDAFLNTIADAAGDLLARHWPDQPATA